MSSDWPWTHNGQQHTVHLKYFNSQCPDFGSFRWPLWPAVFKTQGCWKSEKSEMYRYRKMTLYFDLEHLTLKSTLYTVSTHPLRPILWSTSLYDQLFLRCKVAENWKSPKCTEWPQNDVEHLTVETHSKYPANLCTYPRSPNGSLFHSTTSHFKKWC